MCQVIGKSWTRWQKMTSNGNTAQKHLIAILTETHQDAKTAYKKAIATAPSKETAETIKRILGKFKKKDEQNENRHKF